MKKQTKKKSNLTDFDRDLQRELKNPTFRKWYNYYGKQLEVAFATYK